MVQSLWRRFAVVVSLARLVYYISKQKYRGKYPLPPIISRRGQGSGGVLQNSIGGVWAVIEAM